MREVCVSFGGIVALSDVMLNVYPCDLVAVVGPNGAGKSTLLNAISRVVPSTGQILLHDEDLARVPAMRVPGRGVGRSFQDPPLLDNETVLENVLAGAHGRLRYSVADQVYRRRLVAREEAGMRDRALGLLEFVGLADRARSRAGSLSFGARKLIDIVRAMICGPQLLLLDEPSSGLDAHERLALQNVLVALRARQRVAVLVVEHHMDLVRTVASHVLALQAGRVLMHGTPEEVLDSDEFKDAIVGGGHASGGPAPQDPDQDDAATAKMQAEKAKQ